MNRTILNLFGLLCAFALVQSEIGVQYLNSYDGVLLRLSNRRVNQLQGAPGQRVDLEFILVNNGPAGHFRIKQHSEDGFQGQLSSNQAFLTEGQQQVIEVTGMEVPDRDEGTVIRFTMSVRRNSARRRRETEDDDDEPEIDEMNERGNYGQSGSYGGSYGGTGSYGGDRGDQDPEPVNGNDRHTSVTISFVVRGEPVDDEEKPTLSIKYAANNEDEVCQMGFGEESCRDHEWKFTATVHDEISGLHIPEISPAGTLGASFPNSRDPIRYRHTNWEMGNIEKQTVDVTVTCCLESVNFKIRDVAGNEDQIVTKSKEYGEKSAGGMSKALMYGLIGGGALLVIIIVVIIIVIVCRKKYSPVSQSG